MLCKLFICSSLKIQTLGVTWLAKLVEHVTLTSQGHEFKSHVGKSAYLRKTNQNKKTTDTDFNKYLLMMDKLMTDDHG